MLISRSLRVAVFSLVAPQLIYTGANDEYGVAVGAVSAVSISE
jgi:uncharacterized membrane protein